MQKIPQQIFSTPMLAVQRNAQADLRVPTQQIADANLFAKTCVNSESGAAAGGGLFGPGGATGFAGGGVGEAGDAASEIGRLDTSIRELAPYFPDGNFWMAVAARGEGDGSEFQVLE